MNELSPLGGSEREGELARRAKRSRPGAYGACDDEGRGLLDAPIRGDEDIAPYGDRRARCAVGAAPCGRPQSLPPGGEGGPQGRMRGRRAGRLLSTESPVLAARRRRNLPIDKDTQTENVAEQTPIPERKNRKENSA